MRFTPAQQQAIDARNRELLVSAAAGSGKTAVLVERILRMIVQDGLSIDRMLIVTFTRAAAGEMRERLETRLSDEAGADARLQKQAELVASAQISTIHSFCQQVVRENFQHCQIDPQFGLCDERTRAAYYEESMEEALTEIYERAGSEEALRALTSKYPERDIAEMISSLYRFIMSRPDPMEWLRSSAEKEWSAETIDREPMAETFCREAGLMVDEMISLWQECERAGSLPCFPQKYLTTLRLDGVELQTLAHACKGGLTAVIAALKALKFSRLPVVRPETTDEALQAERFKDARKRYKKLVEDLQALLPESIAQAIADLREMSAPTRGIAAAVERFHEIFSQKKRDQAVIDFNDLEHMTLSILRERELREAMSMRFDAIFVDEYQDVSELQEAILNALKRPPQHPRKQYTFYVGDVKQSIYRFRLAEPGLFLRKLNTFSPDEDAEERKIILNRNFRSKSAVLNAVNRVFSHVMDSRMTEIDYDEDARLYPGLPSKGDPKVELHLLHSESLSSQAQVLAEAEWIAADILSTVGEPMRNGEGLEDGTLHYRDIAILLPVSKNIADKVELVLSAHGIPVYSDTGGNVMGTDEATQLIAYLTVLDNLMNDVALLSVLRSPLFDMSEKELGEIRLSKPEREASFLSAMEEAAQKDSEVGRRCRSALDTLAKERFYAGSMPLGDYLWDYLGRSGMYAYYGAQPGGKLRQANLRMLCDKAGEYEKTHMDGLRGFLEMLQLEGVGAEQSPAVINPWEDVVRIMTIHKSKGLEFPTVYVMNLGRPLFGRAQSHAIGLHGEIGLGLGYVNEDARTKRTTLLQASIALKERNAERSERARVLYVALTRPKSRLVMVGCGGFDGKEALYAQTSRNRYAVRSAHSMLDWIVQTVRPTDELEVVEGFSTGEARETLSDGMLSMVSTSFPQETDVWKVVIHKGLSDEALSGLEQGREAGALPTAAAAPRETDASPADRTEDPIAPKLTFKHLPLKVGVTALCRAIEEHSPEVDDEEESAETKRFPLSASQPRLLSSVPTAPAFLKPVEEQAAIQTGIETHRVLGLLDVDAARKTSDARAFAGSEVKRLADAGVLSENQAEYVRTDMIARFLRSELGARMLASSCVMREWAFNMRVTEPFETIVQGVIDLCFLENGKWVLVDFKTDRVETAAALWPRYRRQLGFYREALRSATPYEVGEVLLYSLRLGESFAGKDL